MFFDIILLKPQHKGQFGKAWLAATRGVNAIPKDEIVQINISKLCEHLTNYIISESTSPTKRFSLRLSSLLVNGTIRILKQQVIILEAEVFSTLQRTYFTADTRLPAYRARRLLDSPLTPIATVRGKKRSKKQVEVTPPSQIEAEINRLQINEPDNIPNIEDVLAIQPTSDLITLRDEAPRQPLVEDLDNFGLQAPLTDQNLLEMGIEPFKSSLAQKPVSSPSSEVIHPQVIEVVAEVHAEKGSLNIPIQPLEEAVQSIRQVDEAVQSIRQVDEAVLRELPLEENVPRERQVRRRISDELSEAAVKKASYRNKIFINRVGRRFLPINRSSENETRFLLKPSRLITTNIKIQPFQQLPINDESSKQDIMLQTDSLQESTLSSRGQLTPRLDKRSTLEALRKPAEETLRSGDSHRASKLGDITTIPPPVIETPIKQPLPVAEETPQIPFQPTELDELPESIPLQPATILHEALTSTPRLYHTFEEQPIRIPDPAASYKERQQRIINIVMNWDFDDEPILKITDVCQKPINRLTISRACHDLLVLCASKYLILYTEEDSTKFKGIKKGPKLL